MKDTLVKVGQTLLSLVCEKTQGHNSTKSYWAWLDDSTCMH